MANSRIMLTCKHCGESLCIGKGYFGGYCTVNEKIHEHLNEFYNKHYQGECSDDIDVSDNARNHFVILEEGESLKDLVPTADVVPKSEVEALQGALKAEEQHNELTMEMAQKALANAKADVAREIFEEIESLFDKYPTLRNIGGTAIAELKKKYTEGEG